MAVDLHDAERDNQVMRDGCPDCRGSDEATWCAGCGGSSSFEAMHGTALARGVYWAHSVAARVATRASWPPFEGRVREIALAKVDDLAGNDWARELLAGECHRRAAEEWEELIAHLATVSA